jgi:translation initiation factor IF-2
LDRIRTTNVAGKEAGGITQGIGASVVTTKEGKEITFIDTPGHAAFSNMRLRGAAACDIAVLVVAQDDGVKPQTIEALNFIKQANIPFVVALTKSDLASADSEKIISQLTKEGLSFEGRGGDVPFVSLSARSGQGIERLLEMISLLADVEGVAKDLPGPLEAIVIETSRTKAGPSVLVVIKRGAVKVGDEIFAEDKSIKVRGLFDYLGKPVKEKGAGYPVQIIGFTGLPQVGSIVRGLPFSSKIGKQPGVQGEYRPKLDEDEKPIIVKASTAGGLEAVIKGIPQKLIVIDSQVGDVNENDVLTAKASKAIIFVFGAKVSKDVLRLAKTEAVLIYEFNIIYKLFEKMEEIAESDLSKEVGRGKIIAEFPFNKKRVAGVKVSQGAISKGDAVTLLRNEKEIGIARVTSVKKGKKDAFQVKTAEECGLIIEPQLDFRIGDVLVSTRCKLN